MQRITKYTFALLLGASMGLASCDKGFEEMNTNPNASTKPNVDYLFSQSILQGNYVYDRVYFYTSYLTCGAFVQHFAFGKEVTLAGSGDKYGQVDSYQGQYFRFAYTNVLTTLGELIRTADANPDLVNKSASARIWRVLIQQRITDLYGDVPYSEAGKAVTDRVYQPKYDAQSAVYDGMLRDLESAIGAFNDGKMKFGAADFVYKGDVAKWKKLGYSLMLRIAMRMTKVAPDKAREWAQKAIAGGIIMQESDQAIVQYGSGSQNYNVNPVVFEIVGQDIKPSSKGADNTENGKFSKTFIDFLKAKNDPRLPVISVVWKDGKPDTSAAIQRGMPNGTEGRPDDFVTYSEPNPATVLQNSAPLIVVSAAEMRFLLTEAVLRTWATGNAAQTYKEGIEIAMRNWALFGEGGRIAPDKINAYTTANALNMAGSFNDQMNQVHSQFWIASLFDEQEAYANWRRTGFPVLVPVNAKDNMTNGTIPRRLPYSRTEQGSNRSNYDAALARQGADLLTTRIWWDK
ncbi:SusD/RagB family nutrient-binding outer membrane lipoprotein [Chitinophaga sp. NPDC101104]|uniref:SusD/RagB family nutrient-binding outer membrane lipoprotein n=1 Tax=Chitinophaga sp. NPDC101104 TaxID=3390561 RepID=UPI003D010115